MKGYTKHVKKLRKGKRHKDYDKVLSGEIKIKTEKEKLEEAKKQKIAEILEREKEKKEALERPKQKFLDEIFKTQREMRKQRAWFFSNKDQSFETWEVLDNDNKDGVGLEVMRQR